MNFEIIGLSGKRGVGKDYIASNYFKNEKTMLIALADQIKVMAIVRENFSFEQMFINKTAETRDALIRIGTDEGRKNDGEDVWCKYLEAWMKVLAHKNGIERFIITDVRFKNEVKWIQSLGGVVIRIEAPQRNSERVTQESIKASNNITEVDLDDWSFKYKLYNDISSSTSLDSQIQSLNKLIESETKNN